MSDQTIDDVGGDLTVEISISGTSFEATPEQFRDLRSFLNCVSFAEDVDP